MKPRKLNNAKFRINIDQIRYVGTNFQNSESDKIEYDCIIELSDDENPDINTAVLGSSPSSFSNSSTKNPKSLPIDEISETSSDIKSISHNEFLKQLGSKKNFKNGFKEQQAFVESLPTSHLEKVSNSPILTNSTLILNPNNYDFERLPSPSKDSLQCSTPEKKTSFLSQLIKSQNAKTPKISPKPQFKEFQIEKSAKRRCPLRNVSPKYHEDMSFKKKSQRDSSNEREPSNLHQLGTKLRSLIKYKGDPCRIGQKYQTFVPKMNTKPSLSIDNSKEQWNPSILPDFEVDQYLFQIRQIWPLNFPYNESYGLRFLHCSTYNINLAIQLAPIYLQDFIERKKIYQKDKYISLQEKPQMWKLRMDNFL